MSATAAMRKRGTNPRRRNLAGEELIIFGNPAKKRRYLLIVNGQLADVLDTRGEAEKGKARLARQGKKATIQVSKDYVEAGRRRPRRNPDELGEAVRLFEVFHGRQPSEVLEEQRSSVARRTYTALGDLSYILVESAKGTVKLEFDGDGVKLAISPNGRQLYLIGGDQNLDGALEDFTDDTSKDLFDLGTALEVEYVARKVHSNYEPIAWYHKFGESKDGAELPRLFYDRLKHEIFFAGGEYFVDDTNEISPGIER
jgi:hypothetical protein